MLIHQIKTRLLDPGALLLLFTVLILFVVPVLPLPAKAVLYPLGFTGLFLFSALCLENRRKLHVTVAIALTVVLHVALAAGLEWLKLVSRMLQVLYFIWVVVALVRQIASSRQVTRGVIISSITAYFLLGLALSIFAVLLVLLVPGAYSFEMKELSDPNRYELMHQLIYYTFVTYTTTGYGDLLPTHPASQSLAIFMASAGQLYIAIIIAMLVGKYTATRL